MWGKEWFERIGKCYIITVYRNALMDQRWQVTHIYKEVIDSWVVLASKVVSRAVVRMMIQRSVCVLYATCYYTQHSFGADVDVWKRKANGFIIM